MSTDLNQTGQRPSSAFSWHAALLGAAVGIAGPAYTGTLTYNVTARVMLANGRSQQEVYAYLWQFGFTLPMVLGFISSVFFALACGWVSAAYGRGSAALQGLVAGLLAASFSVVVLMSPADEPHPVYVGVGLAIQILGSIAGAWAFRHSSQ